MEYSIRNRYELYVLQCQYIQSKYWFMEHSSRKKYELYVLQCQYL